MKHYRIAAVLLMLALAAGLAGCSGQAPPSAEGKRGMAISDVLELSQTNPYTLTYEYLTEKYDSAVVIDRTPPYTAVFSVDDGAYELSVSYAFAQRPFSVLRPTGQDSEGIDIHLYDVSRYIGGALVPSDEPVSLVYDVLEFHPELEDIVSTDIPIGDTHRLRLSDETMGTKAKDSFDHFERQDLYELLAGLQNGQPLDIEIEPAAVLTAKLGEFAAVTQQVTVYFTDEYAAVILYEGGGRAENAVSAAKYPFSPAQMGIIWRLMGAYIPPPSLGDAASLIQPDDDHPISYAAGMLYVDGYGDQPFMFDCTAIYEYASFAGRLDLPQLDGMTVRGDADMDNSLLKIRIFVQTDSPDGQPICIPLAEISYNALVNEIFFIDDEPYPADFPDYDGYMLYEKRGSEYEAFNLTEQTATELSQNILQAMDLCDSFMRLNDSGFSLVY